MGMRDDLQAIKFGLQELAEELRPHVNAYYSEKSMSKDEYDEATRPLRALEAKREELQKSWPHTLSEDDLVALIEDVTDALDQARDAVDIAYPLGRRLYGSLGVQSDKLLRRPKELADRLRNLQRERARRALTAGSYDDYAAPIKADLAEARAELWELMDRYRVDLSKADYIAAAEPLERRISDALDALYAAPADTARDVDDEQLAILVAEADGVVREMRERQRVVSAKRDRSPEETLERLTEPFRSGPLSKLTFEAYSRLAVTEGAFPRLEKAVADGVIAQRTLDQLRPYFYGHDTHAGDG